MAAPAAGEPPPPPDEAADEAAEPPPPPPDEAADEAAEPPAPPPNEATAAKPPARAPQARADVTLIHVCDRYVAVDKPFDMRIDGGREGRDEATLIDVLRARVPAHARELRHCHQLDYATSGVMLYALSRKAAGEASVCFERRTARKTYVALVVGDCDFERTTCDLGVCQDPVDDFRMMCGDRDAVWPPLDEASEDKADVVARRKRRKHSGQASTEVEVLARGTYRGEPATKLLLRPKTGRRHQLRLHCVALGHPIVGDATYGGDTESPRMMLHAHTLALPTPAPLDITAPDPFLPPLLADLVLATPT